MMLLPQYIRPRTVWVASWLLAGGIIVIGAAASGVVSLHALAALYFGLGAGVELTLFIQGRRTSGDVRRQALPPPAASEEETEELVRALRAQGLRRQEAVDLAADLPGGLPFEKRLVMALQQHGEEMR